MAWQVVFEGDSLTAIASGGGTNLAAHILALLAPAPAFSSNVATSGEVINNQMLQQGASQVDPLYTAGRINVLHFWGGTNDIRSGAGGTSTGNFARQWCQARKAAHATVKIIIYTLLPCDFAGQSATYEADRQAFNAYVRANGISGGWADAIVDVGADPRVGLAGQETNLTYRHPDKLHMSDTGRELVAQLAAPAFRTLAGLTVPTLAAALL